MRSKIRSRSLTNVSAATNIIDSKFRTILLPVKKIVSHFFALTSPTLVSHGSSESYKSGNIRLVDLLNL